MFYLKEGWVDWVQILHAESLTPRQMFCTSQVRIATAHAHNIFLLYLGRYKTVKNQLFTNGSYRAEIWWVGSRHQVDTNGTLYIGVRPIGGAWWRGEWHVHHLPITRPCYSKKSGPIEYKFGMQGQWPPTNVLHVANSYRYCACAHHIFVVCRKLLGLLSPYFVY